MDLLRLALERATAAAEAVELITGLLECHGQGGGCGHEKQGFTYHNSFLAADLADAYVRETAGRLWEVERVTTGARSISNGLTIPGFAEQHSDFLKTRVSACRARRPYTQSSAGEAPGPVDLPAILRDHGGVVPRYRLLNGAMAAPCMHAGGVATGSQTTASWVAELTQSGARHWVTATAAPCTGLSKPVSVDRPLDLGPSPSNRFDPETLWWRHERFHRRAMRDPEVTFPSFAPERDEIETRWLASPPDPAEAFRAADEALDRWMTGMPQVPDRRPRFVRHYWAVRDRRAGIARQPPGPPPSPSPWQCQDRGDG
jgi:secernin